MVNKKTFFAFALLAVVVMAAISLTGCGTSSPAAGGGTPALPAYYVNAATGLDTNAGTQAAPFKTITKALATASTGISLNIYVAPGTYNVANGEVLPLMIASSGINLIGDIANKGVGAASTTISGGVAYNATVNANPTTEATPLVIAPGVSASISGFDVSGGASAIIIDNASAATVGNNTLNGANLVVFVIHSSTATITSNVINGWVGIDAEGALATITARGNIINQNYPGGGWGVVTGNFGGAGANMDLGTPASPGNNIILGGQIGLMSWANPAVVVKATGNTWKPNIQGADAQGHYPTPFVASGAAQIGGNNYAITDTTAGIQFYTQGGATPYTGIAP